MASDPLGDSRFQEPGVLQSSLATDDYNDPTDDSEQVSIALDKNREASARGMNVGYGGDGQAAGYDVAQGHSIHVSNPSESLDLISMIPGNPNEQSHMADNEPYQNEEEFKAIQVTHGPGLNGIGAGALGESRVQQASGNSALTGMNLPSDSGNSALLAEPKHAHEYTQPPDNAAAPFTRDDGLGRGAGGQIYSSQFGDGSSLSLAGPDGGTNQTGVQQAQPPAATLQQPQPAPQSDGGNATLRATLAGLEGLGSGGPKQAPSKTSYTKVPEPTELFQQLTTELRQRHQSNVPRFESAQDVGKKAKRQEEDDEILEPRQYQLAIADLIKEQWFSEQSPPRNDYGSIVFMATGTGKTFVAIMLILEFFGLPNERLYRLSDQQLERKRDFMYQHSQQLEASKKKVAFIVPTQNLVEQQAEAINSYTVLRVGKFSGNYQKSQKNQPGQQQHEHWRNQMLTFDVLVFTERKLYDTLIHGLVKLEEFDMVVFDECHHADQSHYYNLIMTDFYYYKYSKAEKRPRILGLTASPIKQKLGDCYTANITQEIKDKLQNLSNNLYSKFVCISPEQIQQLENQQVSVRIAEYNFDQEKIVADVNNIADNLIKKLIRIVPIDAKSMSVYDNERRGDAVPRGNFITCEDPSADSRRIVESMDRTQQLALFVENNMMEEFVKRQDDQVVKFLKKRYEFISLDMKYIKTHIHIQSFKDPEDQMLVLYSIIILKNANNLILELGSYAFTRFLGDIKEELLGYMAGRSQKSADANAVIDGFSLFTAGEEDCELEQATNVSNKVAELIAILNRYAEQQVNPKVIVFVKDRVVAEYLKKTLRKQRELRSQQKNQNNDRLLNPTYRVGTAMGPQGKNLVNKAYRSTKSERTNGGGDASSHPEPSEDDLEWGGLDAAGILGLGGDFVQSSSSGSAALQDGYRQYRNTIGNSGQPVSSSSVRMSSNQLRDVLAKFKTGEINLLIATNVVEEGLDVSECNMVICLNELLNVKAFIQMKGRARQQDSQFIFLCAHEEFSEVEKERKNFGTVIDKMKELAFGQDSIGGIEPASDILERKAVDESDFFEVPDTGARVSIRDAKLLLDQFCRAAQEAKSQMPMGEDPRGGNPEGAAGGAPPRKISTQVRDNVANYQTRETGINEANKKYYLSVLYMPRTCGEYVNHVYRIMPENGFLKKKDAENHVALLALKKMHQNRCFDDFLFPKIGSWANPKKINMSMGSLPSASKPGKKKGKGENGDSLLYGSNYSSSNAMNPNLHQKRKAQISDQEIENFKSEQKEFERQLKNNRSRHFETVEAQFRSLIKEELRVQFGFEKGGYPKVYIHCLKGTTSAGAGANNEFPFKTTCDYLGILFNRNFEQTNPIRFWMFQEKKQKYKNQEYLKQLLKNEIIDTDTFDKCNQDHDMIELELNHKNLIELDFNKLCQSHEEAALKIQELKFFHTWIFYYYYCADHKFLKHIFKQKFTFAYLLFQNELEQLYFNKANLENFFKIYSKNQKRKRNFYKQNRFQNQAGWHQLIQIHPFIIPLLEKVRPDGTKAKLQVNWELIHRVIRYIKGKLLDIIFCNKPIRQSMREHDLENSRKFIVAQQQQSNSFQTFRCSQFANRESLTGIWDDCFTGVRYVQLDKFQPSLTWDYPTLHLEVRNAAATQKGAEPSNSYRNVVQNYQEQNNQPQPTEENSAQQQVPRSLRYMQCANRDHRLDIFTVQQYNFEKYGLFLNPLQSRRINIVRKERHFVDFSKTPKQLENEKQCMSKSAKEDGKKVEDIAVVSSKFDIPNQLMSNSPLSYDQYQVFQQTCTHLQYFNEFLQVDRFIRDKFKDLTCFLQPRDEAKVILMKEKQNRQSLSFDQIISQQKENLQSDLEPADLSRDIFVSPDDRQYELMGPHVVHAPATDQLLNNIDLIMEALTSPNANRTYDYERLEFYGDSVISFLVILELFLTKDYAFKEGPLDFYRIQQVSNMKFYKINIDQHFFKYMINEPQTIFNDFVPGAFDELRYQDRIKHKTLNELNNKVKELRKLQVQVKELQMVLARRQRRNFSVIEVPQLILQLRIYYHSNYERRCSSIADDQIYKTKQVRRKDFQHDEDLLALYLEKISTCIQKIDQQKKKRIEEIDNNMKNLNKKQNQQKMFFFKQLADVVESVTGAATVACGLNLTQNYLRTINVLEFSQDHLKQKLFELKRNKEGHPESQKFVNFKYAENNHKLREVETTIKYTFRNKIWLVEALTHKSYIDQSKYKEDYYASQSGPPSPAKEQPHDDTVNQGHDYVPVGSHQGDSKQQVFEVDPFDDYERLEFLGDAILNFLIAEHFYKTTVNDDEKKMPKELHKMKTSVINNALLSLVVIENQIHEHILYNNKAFQFKEQFIKYVEKVNELLKEGGSTPVCKKALDLDQLYESTLKIFGDVFESIIGAVFIDSESIEVTWKVLFNLMEPYIKIYADLSTLQDHSRTKLLELWNQKPFMRNLKCHHQIQKGPSQQNQNVQLKYNDGRIIFRGMVDDDCIFEVPYDKDAKNKVRHFYRIYYHFMKGFFDELDKKDKTTGGENQNQMMFVQKEEIIKHIKRYRDRHYKSEFDIAGQGGSGTGLAKPEERIAVSSLLVRPADAGKAVEDADAAVEPAPTGERIDSRSQPVSQGTNPDVIQQTTQNPSSKNVE